MLIARMRRQMDMTLSPPEDLIAGFLQAHIDNMIVARKNEFGGWEVVKRPMRELAVRVELDAGMAYMSKRALSEWLAKNRQSLNALLTDLAAKGAWDKATGYKYCQLGQGASEYNHGHVSTVAVSYERMGWICPEDLDGGAPTGPGLGDRPKAYS